MRPVRSLRFKTNAAILIICLIISACFGVVLYPFELRRNQMHYNHIQMLLDAIFLQKEEQIANEIFGGQDKALMLSLSDIQAVQGILNTLIYDMNGRLIQSATIVDSGPFSETDRNRLNHHPLFVIHDDARHPAAEYASQIEVMGEKFGYIRILYDLSDIKRERHQAYLLFAALLIAILVMISIFLNLLLTYLVIKPSSAFVDAIKRLQEGHFGEPNLEKI